MLATAGQAAQARQKLVFSAFARGARELRSLFHVLVSWLVRSIFLLYNGIVV